MISENSWRVVKNYGGINISPSNIFLTLLFACKIWPNFEIILELELKFEIKEKE